MLWGASAVAEDCQGPGCRTPTAAPVVSEARILARQVGRLPENAIDRRRRRALLADLKRADQSFRRDRLCPAESALNAFLRHSEDLEQDTIGRFLFARGWTIRLLLLEEVPPGAPCADPDAGSEPRVDVSASDNTGLSATIHFGEATLQPVSAGRRRFTEVDVPGLYERPDELGAPEVPFVRQLVAVPMGAELSLSVRKRGETKVPVRLYPVQDQAPMGSPTPDDFFDTVPPDEVFADPPFQFDARADRRKSPYPRELCTVQALGQLRDTQVAQIECAAGRYDADGRTMTLFDSLDLQIAFRGGTGAFTTREALGPFEGKAAGYRDSMLNADAVNDYTLSPGPQRQCLGEELVIVTPPEMRPAADTLAEWKRDRGIPTNVFNVNDGPGGGPDTAEEINAFISDRYDSCQVRPSYVLLFGDAEYIPTFYRPYPGNPDPPRDPIPTDWPYTQSPLTPGLGWEFAVGRLPIDPPQADTVVGKLIAYEQNPPGNFAFTNGAAVASQFDCCRIDDTETDVIEDYPDGTDHGWFIGTVEDVRSRLQGESYTVERIYEETIKGAYDGNTTPKYYRNGDNLPSDLQAPFPWDGDTAAVTSAWNSGRSLMIHLDHGGASGWSHPNFDTADANGLVNGGLLPFVLSFNCSSGHFDNETDGPPNEPLMAADATSANYLNFSEALIRNPNGGAAGVIAATRTTFGHGNIMIRGSLDSALPDMDTSFGSSFPNRRMGDMLNHARLYMLEKYGYSADTVRHWYLYNLLGDPTLELWTAVSFELPRVIELIPLPDYIEVHYPLDGVTMTAWQETPQGLRSIGRGVVRDGVARLDYFQEPSRREPIMVSGYAENAIPGVLGQTRAGP